MADVIAGAESTVASPEQLAQVMELVTCNVTSRCLLAVADLGVADVLGEGIESAAALAEKTGANADALVRILRLLATKGIFLDLGDRFRHTPLSRLLRTDHPQSMRGLARAIRMAWLVLGALDHSIATGRPAAEKLAPGGIWGYLAAHPDEARRFDETMTSKATAQVASVLGAYDFSQFKSIADVGGGRGHLLRAVLDAAPRARGVLFDLPRVIEGARGIASDRLMLQPGDFFTDALPVCDAYLLMNVIHDWNDDESIAILKSVRKAALANAKLLLLESPLPEVPGPHPMMVMDVIMLAYSTGRERKRSAYEALLRAADFRVDQVIPTPSGIAILEASPA
jgi:hypothetical protein